MRIRKKKLPKPREAKKEKRFINESKGCEFVLLVSLFELLPNSSNKHTELAEACLFLRRRVMGELVESERKFVSELRAVVEVSNPNTL